VQNATILVHKVASLTLIMKMCNGSSFLASLPLLLLLLSFIMASFFDTAGSIFF